MINLLSVENLTKSHADKVLLDKVSFGIAKGEKLALIARNGSGKTTLMRILAGMEAPDSGIVTLRKDIRVAYLDQDPQLDPELTILETIFSMDNPTMMLVREYESCLELDAEAHSPQTQRNLELAAEKMDDAGAWDYEVRVRQVLTRLNIHQLERKISQLSGGQRKRIALAHTLIEPADLLLLDEPTNHLDVEMVEWLEEFLTRSNISLLLVTHDRYFLENICKKIIELDRGQIYSYEGNYTYFLERKAEREFNADQEKDKAQNILRTELEWMRRMPKARSTKSKSRIDAFYELKEKAMGRKKEDGMQLDIKMNRIGGKVIELKKVYKSFADVRILNGFDYTFKTGERIGIIGRNGTGKSTFLNMLTGLEQPDSGKINVGDTLVFGYYSQQGLVLKEDKRVIEVVKDFADVIQLSDGAKVSASQFLNLFQFPPEQQYTYVSKLSGGERRRLHLLTVLIKNPNFLILDEPTNDLDLLTLGILEEFLLHYKGCLLLVSHDRFFMDKLVDHLFIFEGNGEIRDFNGTYSEYRMSTPTEEVTAKIRMKIAVKNEVKQAPSEKKKLSYRERLEMERLEQEINVLEHEKLMLSEQLNSGNATHVELRKWSERLETLIKELDSKSLRWLELSELAGI